MHPRVSLKQGPRFRRFVVNNASNLLHVAPQLAGVGPAVQLLLQIAAALLGGAVTPIGDPAHDWLLRRCTT